MKWLLFHNWSLSTGPLTKHGFQKCRDRERESEREIQRERYREREREREGERAKERDRGRVRWKGDNMNKYVYLELTV